MIDITRITEFQVIHFRDSFANPDNGKRQEKEVIILYGLGEDGIVYEMVGGKWLGLPVTEANMREMPQPPPEVVEKLTKRN